MSKRENEFFLFDILVAILKIEKVSANFANGEDLKYDFMAWDTVIREFEIIGEATNILIKNSILAKENQVVVDFRNLLIHHYFGIDSEEVWNVIECDIKYFKITVLSTIKNIDNTLKKEILEDIIEENKHLDFIIDTIKTGI